MSLDGKGGLIELVLVFGLVLAFGFVELRTIRRDRRKADEKAKTEAGAETPRRE